MPVLYNRWFQTLIRKGWLSPIDPVSARCLRLATPLQLIVPEEIIRELVDQYDPANEKGGVMMAAFQPVNGKLSLKVKHLIFIDNHSPYTSDSYLPNEEVLRTTIKMGFDAHLIPLIFHTHPTKSNNIVDEIKNFHYQMETSSPDRFVAMGIKYCFNGHTLRLPEVLVIGNGTSKYGLFIGIYGGLVAPLGFNKQKNKRMYKWLLSRAYEIAGSINTWDDFAVAGLIGLFVHEIARHNKPATKDFIQHAKQMLPPLVYADAEQHDFFGITHKATLKINLPTVSDNSIIEEEKMLQRFFLQQHSGYKKYYFNYAVDLSDN